MVNGWPIRYVLSIGRACCGATSERKVTMHPLLIEKAEQRKRDIQMMVKMSEEKKAEVTAFNARPVDDLYREYKEIHAEQAQMASNEVPAPSSKIAELHVKKSRILQRMENGFNFLPPEERRAKMIVA